MHSVSYTIVFAYSCKHRHVFSLSSSAFWTFTFAFEDTYWPSVGSFIRKDDFFFVFAFCSPESDIIQRQRSVFLDDVVVVKRRRRRYRRSKNVSRLFRPPLLVDGLVKDELSKAQQRYHRKKGNPYTEASFSPKSVKSNLSLTLKALKEKKMSSLREKRERRKTRCSVERQTQPHARRMLRIRTGLRVETTTSKRKRKAWMWRR